ncbi:protease-4 [Kineosphaera limosa]|uniref:Putative signal peptide peptidase n=1 Tax=Kineosphaera limosa NBRC 100340 TaxID=1184609 RepID=K6XBK9_9MICO|nr:signal peptide peptidase SppA [Kineosphaera limosa]NYE03268.1 protease-4 [Kineosphaera limosa]GAB96209.1 putative signal peptide peptidase [Kineosphaera limosa NBRC 100340]
MDFLRDLAQRLPIDEKYLKKVPIPGLQGRCLLEIDLARGLTETSPASPLEALRERNTPSLKAVVDGLRKGADDERVAGLIVHAAAGIGISQAQELRAAIEVFRASGKPTVAWSESYGELTQGTVGYLVACACEQVWVQPSGDAVLTGFVAGGLFLRGALDKLDALPQFVKRKEYKSAAETFMNSSMSEPNREMLDQIITSVNESVTQTIAASRGLSVAQVQEAFDAGRLGAQQARERGFVDEIGYRDEALAALRVRVGAAEDDSELRFVERYRKAGGGPAAALKRGRPVVAVVQATGPIHLGRAGGKNPMSGHSVGSDTLGAALRAAARDKAVRALVLRVDSPGGSYVASDAIRREVLRVRDAGKPVIASMGSVAASGGYFIAMPAQRIVANPATLTGSIGVLAGKIVVGQSLQRIGVAREELSHGRFDDMFSQQRPFTDDELTALDEWLDEVYADFTTKAADDRGMPIDQLEPLARGRVWSGADAVAKGLADELGGLDTALGLACAAAGFDRDDCEARLMPKLGPLDRLMPTESSESPVAAFGEGPGLFAQLTSALGLPTHGVLTMPDIRIR